LILDCGFWIERLEIPTMNGEMAFMSLACDELSRVDWGLWNLDF
jgi:hypothetical protein